MSIEDYSADRPIATVEQDEFSRKEFAKNLAAALTSKHMNMGYVVGLFSKWGYGKTSTLNMIQTFLDDDESVVTMKFNPWIFSDRNSMIAGFFDSLAAALKTKLATRSEEIGSTIKKYSSLLSPISIGLPGATINAGEIAKHAGNLMDNSTLDELKERIEKLILDSDKRLIVIIDDVDRLDKEEIFQLFKLIKIAVDFRQVTYLIAFDDVIVGDILAERFPGSTESGQSFLEKIIQIPVHLPLITRFALDKYIFNGLDDLLKELSIEISDEEVQRFRSVFDENIAPLIDTPRMANRYLNSLKFAIPIVGKEINIADLFILDAIRLLYPRIYHKLRKSKQLLTGSMHSSMFAERDEIHEHIKTAVDALCDNQPILLNILKVVFPAIEDAYARGGSRVGNTKALKIMKRAASLDYFDRYFTYGIPAEDVSDVRILELVELGERELITPALIELLTEKNADVVIQKLRTYTEDIKDGVPLALALSDVVDKLPNPAISGFNRTPLEMASDIIIDLLRKPKKDRLKNIKLIIEEANDLDLLTYIIRDTNTESDIKKTDPLLTSTQLSSLKQSIALKISIIAAGRQPLHDRGSRIAAHLYQYWVNATSKEVVATYITGHTSTFNDAVTLLTSYTAIWYGGGPPKRGDFDESSYRYLEKVADLTHLFKIIQKQSKKYREITEYPEFLDGENILGNEKDSRFIEIIASQFIYVYQKLFKEDDS